METLKIPGIVLMENAGRNAAQVILNKLADPQRARVVILCGTGNNGGDGFVIARHLAQVGVTIDVVIAGQCEKIAGDARANFEIVAAMDLPHVICENEVDDRVTTTIANANVVVDALLGTGATGAPRGVMGKLVQFANKNRDAQKFAIDVPSGLDADSAEIHEPCFRADATITMVAAKTGFSQACSVVGEIIPVDIGVSPAAVEIAD